jgi:hypothetical protein
MTYYPRKVHYSLQQEYALSKPLLLDSGVETAGVYSELVSGYAVEKVVIVFSKNVVTDNFFQLRNSLL